MRGYYMGIGSSFKGFETIFAGIRMFWQMLLRLFIVMIILHAIIISSIIYFNHDKLFGKINNDDLCIFKTYIAAKIAYDIRFNKSTFKVDYECGQFPMKLNYTYFQSKFEPYVIHRWGIIKKQFLSLLLWTALVYLLMPIFIVYFNYHHKKDSEDKFIRGAKIVPADKLKYLMSLKHKNEFSFRITKDIQIPIGIITRHCICLGKPGTGKTQLISRIIDQIIKNGYRAVIHDFKGDFINTFYDFRKHFIFNPLDKRHMGLKDFEMDLIDQCNDLKFSDLDLDKLSSLGISSSKYTQTDRIKSCFEYSFMLDNILMIVDSINDKSPHISIKENKHTIEKNIKGWSIFNELKSSIDIDAFCASLIPESASQDNFWPISSRQLLGSIITYCIHNNCTSYSDLWKLVNLGNKELLGLFKNCPGCEEGTKLLTEDKTANNILAVLSNYTKPIKYLIGTEGNFSIKEWVKDTNNERKIIFLSNYAMIQETIRPFLTMFADFSIKTLLSLEDDLNRRLFFILDEFGELGKIGTIVPLLTGSRSKGGAGFILIQDTARINSIYGADGCSTIVNACGNMISFAVKKEEADFVSDCFGKVEIKRTEESKSMGVDDISDSISISKQTVEKQIVMASEVTNIPTLNFFIQLTDYPVSRDKLEIVKLNKKAQAYIGREDLLFKAKSNTQQADANTSINTSYNTSNKNDQMKEDRGIAQSDTIAQKAAYFGNLEPLSETENIEKPSQESVENDNYSTFISENVSNSDDDKSTESPDKFKIDDDDGMLF